MAERPQTTKARIVEAAEALFAEGGISATSLRHITARAGVNLAAVNYHFGSRDALIEAVYARRLQPLNVERLRKLKEIEAQSSGQPLSLHQIIRAFIEPVLRVSRDPVLGGPLFIRLVGQSYTEGSTRFERFFTGQYRDVLERFAEALAAALPSLEREEIYWRLHFMIGATAYTIADAQLLRLIAGTEHVEDVEVTLSRLVPFLIAGFEAPAAAPAVLAPKKSAAS
ncbi:MAG: TetR/AcrR family transcriptional regulator [Gammaproteobacteria bacterium]